MMKSDTDILTAAAMKLGWTQIHLNDAPHHAYQGLVGTRDGSHFEPLPALLTSLDAHNAPGSTIDMILASGLEPCLTRENDIWHYSINAWDDDKHWGVWAKTNADLPRAMTIAFLRWPQPQENWE